MNIFQQLFRVVEFCMAIRSIQLTWRFLSTNISQGSVATHLTGGGVFYYCFITNLLLSLSVKEFWKSVTIWQS